MKMSRRAARMLENRFRHRADMELNLIPMIDILSVMVSFLLVYSTEVEVLQNSKGIEIPQSISEQRPNETVVVMLTKDQVFVQGELIGTLEQLRASSEPVFTPLKAALTRKTLIGRKMASKSDAAREITVMADKTLPYELLKKVLATCTDADFGKVSFALTQKDKPVDAASIKGL